VLPENPGDFFDEVWYVYTLKEYRIQRLMKSRGYSEERCLKIMEGQAAEEEFRKAAGHVIDNNGSMDDVRRQVAAIMNCR
ncbi:MAG: dephospho-CoA kinase, partial [Hungatella sp.]|nr:dephospho-CoA kinase [Hungatella sp.]